MSAVIRGPVSVKVTGLLKSKQLPGEWGVLYDAGSKGNKPPRLELFMDEDSKKPVHTLILEILKFPDKSYRQHERHFHLSIKKEKYQFLLTSVEDKEDWVQSLCHVSTELWKQRLSALQASDFEDSEGSQDAMNENFLYETCEKDAVQQFKVSICPNKASDANNLQGNYILSPSKESLRLIDMVSFRQLHEWPYKQIRKYGRTRQIFKMEVGRKCSTGEGEFEFFTPDGSTLTDWISIYMRGVRENTADSQDMLDQRRMKVTLSSQSSSDSSCAPFPNPAPRSKLTPSPSGDKNGFDKRAGRGRDKPPNFNTPADASLYDEPEDWNQTQKTRSSPVPDVHPPDMVREVYSTPQTPDRDGWKKHGRPDSQNTHVENYNKIKTACLSDPKPRTPFTFPQRASVQSRAGDDEEDTYNRLGAFSKQTSSQNIYGAASAIETLAPRRYSPVGGDEYAEVDPISTRSQRRGRPEVANEYEDV